MRKENPNFGDTRTITKFAWCPITLPYGEQNIFKGQDVTVWLETVSIFQEYIEWGYDELHQGWCDRYFV